MLDLSEPYRSTLLLRFFEQLSAEEIARRTGVPPSTVRNRTKRALDSLRERFDREHAGDRRAWALQLLPIAAPGVGATAVSTGAAAPLSLGGTSMSMKALIASIATLFLGFAGAFAYRQVTASDAESAAPTSPPNTRSAGVVAQEPTPAPRDPHARKPLPVPPEPEQHVVSGRVTDAEGRPIAGAWVLVGGQPSPFEGWFDAAMDLADGGTHGNPAVMGEGGWKEWAALPPAKLKQEGLVLGRRFRTDEQGGFEARLPRASHVYVNVMRGTGVRNDPDQGVWIDTPGRDLDLTAQRVPTATVSVRATEQQTGVALQAFAVHLTLHAHAWSRTLEARGGALEGTFELPAGADTLTVELVEPRWAQASAETSVAPGEHAVVELGLDAGTGFRGRVVDAFGNPVQDALVFWGTALKMRDGNPFRPYSTELVPDAVRTAADGSFTLPGAWHEVTAFHADSSPATAPVQRADVLVLGERSRVQGFVVDDAGQPVAGSQVTLDGKETAPTDADGRYVFERVEAGVHSLRFADRRWRGITVPAGVTYDVPSTPVFAKVLVEVLSGGAPYAEPMSGLLMGLEDFFTLHEFQSKAAGFSFPNALPGKYILLTRFGHLATFEVESTQVVLELGRADLRVEGKPGQRVYLLPLGSGEVVRHWAGRMAQEIGESGHARFGPLVSGTYELGIQGQGPPRKVEVPGPGTVVWLD